MQSSDHEHDRLQLEKIRKLRDVAVCEVVPRLQTVAA
jgi:hypothetical protein